MKTMKEWGFVFTVLLMILCNSPLAYAANESSEEHLLPQGALVYPAGYGTSTPIDVASGERIPPELPDDFPASVARDSAVVEVPADSKSDDFILYDIPLSKELQRYTFDLSKSYGVDYKMVLAVMYVESKFQSSVRSQNTNGTVDSGLMQVNSGYKKWQASIAGIPLKEYDSADPHHNIRVGIAELAYARNYWAEQGITGKNLDLYMLNSYNMGIGGYTKYVKSGNLSRSYDRKVMSYLKTSLIPK